MRNFLSTVWKTVFFNPFLNILFILYAVLGDNMGLAVIAMAVLIRLLLLPTTKRQINMTNSMSQMQPKLKELQEKYKNNPEQLSKEQMKLYKDSGYNPLGCLGTFLPQILILAAIFGVIRTVSTGDFSGLYEPVANFVFPDGNYEINTQFLFWDLGKSFTDFTTSYFDIQRLPYFLLGVGVGVTQFVATKFSQGVQSSRRPKKENNKGDDPMSQAEMTAQMSKSMVAIFPLMTAYFTLSQPSILGIYWFAQSVMLIVQYFILDRETSIKMVGDLLPKNSWTEWMRKEENKPTNSAVSKEEVKEIDAKKVDVNENTSENQQTDSKKEKKKKKKRKKRKRKKR